MSAITIMDYLAEHVAQQPDKLALVCVEAKSAIEWSYSALYKKVLEVASHIQYHSTPGERALILMDTGIDYVVSFLACQYVGITAIPSFPPESIKPQHLARTIGITENAQATLVLTTSRFSETVSLLCEEVAHCQMLLIDTLGVAVKPAIRYEAKTEDIAFLQYTSGSTATPKGVMISHGNLIANERVITQRMETSQKDVMVSWLPLFHDMGLIGGLLQPLFVGCPLVLASPRYFMERPLRWLQLLSDYQGTISGGPDFSFRLCLERVNPTQIEALDLSHWRVAYSGAEPIRHDTLLDFADKYACCGFSKAALYPCYGLAEGTLMVSGSHAYTGACIQAFSNEMLAEGKAQAVTSQDLRNTDAYSHQVSCGIAGSDHDIRIVCPTTFADLADGLIGEVWTAGPSIALGYWQNESATHTTFVMHDGKRWLRTGDVGYLWQEQLFISGRRKDLIISNGHNIYPQDIERAIEANLSFVRKGRVAAFPVPSDETGEGIGLAIEVVTTYKNEVCPTQTAHIIRDFIISHFSTTPELVLLLEQGTLPKTSSGKLQRSACLKLFQLNKLSCYADFDRNKLQSLQVTAQTLPAHWLPLQLKMAELWQQVLRYPIQSDDVDFFALGGSSIKAAQLMAEVQHTFGCQLPSSSLFNAPQFAVFCQLVQHLGQAESTVAALQAQHNSHYPLSAQQLRQLFLWQLEPKSSAYHIGAAFYLHGKIDVTLMKQACEQVFAQHQILSHAYVKNQHKGWQQSSVPQQLDWQEHDYTGQTKALAQASHWLNEFSRAPFALNEGKIIRVAVVRVSEKQVIWSMVMHHIAGDAWSFEIISKQVASIYQSLQQGESVTLQPAALHYGDYAHWQQEWLTTTTAQTQLGYWQERLQGVADEELLAPEHKDSMATQSASLGLLSTKLGYKQVEQLQGFAHQHRASLYMLLLASIQVACYRFSGKRKPRIGVPVANRRLLDTHAMVGFFVNTQVIAGELSPSLRFVDVLQNTRAAALDAQQNQDYPFEKLVEILNPQRQLGQNPLFQLMFNHVEYDLSAWSEVEGIRLEEVLPIRHQAQFDLSIDSRLFKDGTLELEIQFNTQRFTQERIEQWQRAWQAILQQALTHPTMAIGNLPLASITASAFAAGKGAVIPEQPRCWLTELSRFARQYPDKTALIYDDQRYDYQWLEETSNRLAHGIAQHVHSKDMVFGIMLPRTPLMLASTLACLKAGVGYLPLDPKFPETQLSYMLTDSDCQCVLTDQPVALAQWQGQALSPTQLLAESGKESGNNVHLPELTIHGQQLAYVNYTSGSTGAAKGIGISHHALQHYIASAIDFIQLESQDVVLQFATANFDAFVEQVFPTWAVGATLVLRDDSLWSPDKLYQQAQQHQISVMDLSAAYWRAVAANWAQRAALTERLSLPHLRQVHSGGEAMSVQAIAQWRQAGLTDVRLLNTYGPTEGVVEASLYDCTTQTMGDQVPLGKALQGRQLYVLDENLELVVSGEVGELYIGGEILARGYWKKPAQTAVKFIADPFAGAGARMYATGDLVRWQHGVLMYEGRRDHQVKIRGFRVELGAIEQQLKMLPLVSQAIVLTEEQDGVLSLIAYVERASSAIALDETTLKRALSERLPHYMVPACFVVMQHLPMNASGKLDRRNLPTMATLQPTVKSVYTDKTALQQQVYQVWQQHLKREEFDLDSNFFDLGGHSLLLMAVHESLQQSYPNLQLMDLFTYPSVSSLANFLEQQTASALATTTIKTPDSRKQKHAMNAFAAKKRTSREG